MFPKTALFLLVGFSISLIGFGRSAQAALTINLNFNAFNAGAPSNGSAALGGATRTQAQNVITTAAKYWESVFANSSSSIAWNINQAGTVPNILGTLTQNLDVVWGNLSGSKLATGGTSYFGNGQWAGGTLTWDNTGTNFYVDGSPADNSEWMQSSSRDMTFAGVDVNVERVYFDAAAGPARANNDMLSVAIHEIGHSLGFLGNSYTPFGDSDVGNDGDIDITSGPLDNAEIPYSGGHTNFTILSPSDEFPYNLVGGSFTQFQYGPNSLSPSIVTGTRKLLTEADIAIVAEFLQFDMTTVNFNPSVSAVPEPSSFACVGLVGAVCIYRRSRKRSRR